MKSSTFELLTFSFWLKRSLLAKDLEEISEVFISEKLTYCIQGAKYNTNVEIQKTKTSEI